MATNLKAKKKTGTYDNKLILWISAGLAAFVVLVVSIFLIISYTTNYVAKVDGMKIYTYEYKYFLSQAFSEKWEEPEGYKEMSAEEQEKAFDAFFTDEVRAECQKNALEEARKFKAQYRLAVNKGFKLTATERAQMKSMVDYYYNMYMSQGYSDAQAVYMTTGGMMTLSEYKSYSILQGAIENYKNSMKEDYKVTTEAMKEIYDEDPDAYRKLTGRVFQFALPTKPSVPKDEKGNDIDLNTKDEKWADDIDNYNKRLDKYNAGIAHYTKLCEDMQTAIDNGEKFTLYEYEYNETEKKYEIKKDKDGKESVLSKDATFDALCALSAWSSASSNKGVFTVGAGTESNVEEIDEYMLQMQWNEARDGFIFVEKVEEEEEDASKDDADKESDDEASAETSSASDETKDEDKEDKKEEEKVKPSKLHKIEIKNDDGVLTALYLVRVEDIDDFDTAVEVKEGEEEDKDALNNVQSTIKSEILEDMAMADLDKQVEAAGKKFAVKSKKQGRMDEILKNLLA